MFLEEFSMSVRVEKCSQDGPAAGGGGSRRDAGMKKDGSEEPSFRFANDEVRVYTSVFRSVRAPVAGSMISLVIGSYSLPSAIALWKASISG